MVKIISILSLLPLVFALLLPFLKNKFSKQSALWATFIFSFGAIIGSLYFSSVLHYPPCVLCWWARIFLYPTAVISLIGIIRKDFSAHVYNLFLSGLALVVTGYHTYITFVGNELIFCGTTGSCSARYVMEFGFVTIPTMALFVTLFIFINSFLAYRKNSSASI